MALAVVAAVALVVTSLRSHLIYFYTPVEITPSLLRAQQPFRLGGLVKPGSYSLAEAKGGGSTPIHCFIITDNQKSFKVHYEGLLPTLFREGQGVIAQGLFKAESIFKADQILAKHDENYMPPEVARKLQQHHPLKVNPGDLP